MNVKFLELERLSLIGLQENQDHLDLFGAAYWQEHQQIGTWKEIIAWLDKDFPELLNSYSCNCPKCNQYWQSYMDLMAHLWDDHHWKAKKIFKWLKQQKFSDDEGFEPEI